MHRFGSFLNHLQSVQSQSQLLSGYCLTRSAHCRVSHPGEQHCVRSQFRQDRRRCCSRQPLGLLRGRLKQHASHNRVVVYKLHLRGGGAVDHRRYRSHALDSSEAPPNRLTGNESSLEEFAVKRPDGIIWPFCCSGQNENPNDGNNLHSPIGRS